MPPHFRSNSRQLILYSLGTGVAKLRNLGSYGYSYGLMKETFLENLRDYAPVNEIVRPESQLEFAVARAQAEGKTPLVFGFVPFQNLHPTKSAPTVIYMCWEFPDVPVAPINGNPRFNWPRISKHTKLIIVPTQFVKDVLEKAGVQTPIRVVPVPMPPKLFELPLWQAGQSVTIKCPGIFLDANLPKEEPAKPKAAARRSLAWRGLKWVHIRYVYSIRPMLPMGFDEALTKKVKAWKAKRAERAAKGKKAIVENEDDGPSLTLGGVVYTMIFNPSDARKNWQDLITAFVHALRDKADATLVLKMSVSEELSQTHIDAAAKLYRTLSSIPHRCRVVVIAKSLTEAQMASLIRATTYYANITRAEGACLPNQEALAAGRPSLSPTHTAMSDYFDDSVGFVVEMSPEPTTWPGDATRKISTTWARLNWQSLHDQLLASYDVAHDAAAYRSLAQAARQRLREYADPADVREKLHDALDSVGASAIAVRQTA